MTQDQHRALREALGPYVLGHLGGDEAARVRTHLETCFDCRAEHAALTPLAAALRDVAPDRLDEVPEPGPLLRSRIEAQIGAERAARRRRALLRRTGAGVAAAVLLVAAFAADRRLGDDPAPVPLEAVPVTSEVEGVSATADLVDHTWGVEIKLTVTGLEDGETYTTTVERGRREYAAGAFIGVEDVEVLCNMTASVLREDATGFTVLDDEGRPVLRAEL